MKTVMLVCLLIGITCGRSEIGMALLPSHPFCGPKFCNLKPYNNPQLFNPNPNLYNKVVAINYPSKIVLCCLLPNIQKTKKEREKRRKFSPEEDSQILNFVEKYGTKNWTKIAIPGRSVKQCRERYTHYLKPNLSDKPWTQGEEKLLEEKLDEYGKALSTLQAFFPDRTTLSIRNKIGTLPRKQSLQSPESKASLPSKTEAPDTQETSFPKALDLGSNNVLSPPHQYPCLSNDSNSKSIPSSAPHPLLLDNPFSIQALLN